MKSSLMERISLTSVWNGIAVHLLFVRILGLIHLSSDHLCIVLHNNMELCVHISSLPAHVLHNETVSFHHTPGSHTHTHTEQCVPASARCPALEQWPVQKLLRGRRLSRRSSKCHWPVEIILCPFPEPVPWHWAMGNGTKIDYLSCRQVLWCRRLSSWLSRWSRFKRSINRRVEVANYKPRNFVSLKNIK